MLKVMTLNINYYGMKHGPWSVRKGLIQKAIQDTNPDIIALQAVQKDPAIDDGIDQAAQLAELLPEYKYVIFQAAMIDKNGSSKGSAFLSRLKFAKIDYLNLSLYQGLEDTDRRIVLKIVLDSSAGPFHLFNAHFSWVYRQALDNLHEALPYINSFAGNALFVGDLNMTPDTGVINQLGNGGWTDVWSRLCSEDAGYTFESHNLTKRIDLCMGK